MRLLEEHSQEEVLGDIGIPAEQTNFFEKSQIA